MDNFTIKLLDKPINWKCSGSNRSLNQESSTMLNWNEMDNLYLECQLQDQASNVTNVINESYASELNIKMHQQIRTNRQSSASDVIDCDETQEINEENQKQINELPQRPVLKKSNTSYRSNNKSFTELIREKEKFKRYRNNRKSARTLSMVCLKRSLMTPKLLNSSKESKKHFTIKYFDSDFCKQFKVDKEMRACELIVLAIAEYKKTKEFDQSLLKYPNFTLAYQLISYEDQCDFSAFSSKMNSVEKQLDNTKQYQYISDVDKSIQDRRIEFDLVTQISFTHLTLISNEVKQYGLTLDVVGITLKQYPNEIILLIEDEKNKTFYNIKCDLHGNVTSIFNELQGKASFKFMKNEFYFTLKYPCVNFIQNEPVPDGLPISLLPIHWLVIKFKFDQNAIESSSSLNFRDLQIQSEGMLSTKKSFNLSIVDFKDKTIVCHQMYNYEEFQLLKIENDGCINQITIGIDYFDIYYYYTVNKNRKCTLGSLAKSFVKMLLKDAYSGQSKDYKRIPMNSVLSITQNKEQYLLNVKYQKQDSKCKRKIFTIPQIQDKTPNEINKQYILSFDCAINKLIFIFEKRKKQFNN